MTGKKWIKIYFIISLLIPFNIFINYILDPMNIFGSNFFKNYGQVNERFIKIDFLLNNHNKFNSYIFGSSRIGTTDPSVIEKYIPDSKFYNFAVSSGNMYDYLMHLEYMIKNKYNVKNLYLQIDINDMFKYKVLGGHRKLHPLVLGQSLNEFYKFHLLGIFPIGISSKIEANFFSTEHKVYDINTGVWSRPDREKSIIDNCQEYVLSEVSFHNKNRRIVRLGPNANETIISLKEIKDICIKHNIKLYIFTTPHNKNLMDTYITEEYISFLYNLSQVVDFYDFSGYNSVTMNNCNYYEQSHYRPLVAKLIAAKIFNDTLIEILKDFGKLITKDNIEEHIKKRKQEIEEYDKMVL